MIAYAHVWLHLEPKNKHSDCHSVNVNGGPRSHVVTEGQPKRPTQWSKNPDIISSMEISAKGMTSP